MLLLTRRSGHLRLRVLRIDGCMSLMKLRNRLLRVRVLWVTWRLVLLRLVVSCATFLLLKRFLLNMVRWLGSRCRRFLLMNLLRIRFPRFLVSMSLLMRRLLCLMRMLLCWLCCMFLNLIRLVRLRVIRRLLRRLKVRRIVLLRWLTIRLNARLRILLLRVIRMLLRFVVGNRGRIARGVFDLRLRMMRMRLS